MNSKTFLLLSVALNVVCMAILLGPTRVPQPEQAPPQKLEATPAVTEVPFVSPAPLAPPVAPTLSAPAPRPFHWGQIESTDYAVYVANLRSIGCPEQTIRDIISADLLAAMNQVSANPVASMEMTQAQVVQLANRLLYPPSDLTVGYDGQPRAAAPEPTTERPPDNGAVAALLANRRRQRFEAMERLWLPDSIRARYGVDALLSWQQQAMQEGVSFAEFLQRHEVTVPPLGSLRGSESE